MDNEEQYKILKLRSGDSIICEVTKSNADKFVLYRPMMFKTVTMVDPGMRPTDVLFMRNWAEYTTEQTIEIPSDLVIAEFKPNVSIMHVYEMEKIKQDFPEVFAKLSALKEKQDLSRLLENMSKMNPEDLLNQDTPFMPNPQQPNSPPMDPNGKPMIPNGANFNLQLPLDIAKELINFLEEHGIDIQGPAFPDDDMEEGEIYDNGEDDGLEDSPGPKLEFGNNLEDWSPDPSDYLK
jgi:hypothetical protein